MIGAALNGAMGSWSPSVILANAGNAIDRIADRPAIADRGFSTGAAASFERALAEELLKAGDIDRLDIGVDLQNGVLLSKSGEIQQPGGRDDRLEPGASHYADVADDAAAAGPYRRVGFDIGDASERLSAGADRRGRGDDGADLAALWIGDRIVDQQTFRGNGSSFVDDPLTDPVPMGKVFFNGDGRPIVLPSIDVRHHREPFAADGLTDDGDLMILPDGAVLAYDPWTATADGARIH